MVLFRPVLVTLAAQHVFHAAFTHDRPHIDVDDREGAKHDGTNDVDDERKECAVFRQRPEHFREQKQKTGSS